MVHIKTLLEMHGYVEGIHYEVVNGIIWYK